MDKVNALSYIFNTHLEAEEAIYLLSRAGFD